MSSFVVRRAPLLAVRLVLFGTFTLAFVGSAPRANALVLLEIEADGTAVNNSIATANAIPPGAFTVDPNPDIFTAAEGGLPGTAVTATIVGRTGGDDSLDIDFYSFTLPAAGDVWLDIDSDRTTIFDPDTTLQLFDSTGTLIAQNDDSFFDLDGDLVTEPDPGSFDEGGASYDSFIGALPLSAGTYYAAVAEYSNFATGGFTGVATSMDSNFYPVGFGWWESITGATVGDDSFGIGSGPQSAAASYMLHISTNAVPEPSAMALLAIAGVFGAGCRKR